ncbi:hypothetical protein M5X00_09125 [Paenibacillus alvei]|uniref:Uncharacterized protein n=1 Tax=Paenibacillus alvei TaxID=44250 RepID=A0ABT4GSR7_PAEAL|nr:hypothetical protein [Paenibacillus alvei]EJW18165.1 hypothetical protein PAV_3c06160 [Paenibacillus alvei DSM 29]MCY9543888.1 hypothetical protein [Paenibacillus alvei]MCY9703654.1 hypothetical protein [Paenibacillus alvei]MCY9732534.1 hypothetical protein [Paenibacillus alvei]MCY9754407.1 hypothetical protein [Paenibacillus alvei]
MQTNSVDQLQTKIMVLYNEAFLIEPILAEAIIEVFNFACQVKYNSKLHEEWIENMIEQRTWEVVANCEKSNEQVYEAFAGELQKLEGIIPNDRILALEDLFVQKLYGFNDAYKTGVGDGMMVEQMRRKLACIQPVHGHLFYLQ